MTVAPHTDGPAPHRARLVAAMAELVAERGYPAVTVTDVVARARVSKRTFYEHFAEREDCFLAAYVEMAEVPLAGIAEAAAAATAEGLGVPQQVRRVTGAYLDRMGEQPGLTRALLTQVASVGPRGRAVRRAVLHRFADQLVALAAADAGRHPEVRPLTPALALALVAGINELVLDAVDAADPDAALGDLAGTVTDLVVAVLLRPA